uniref:Uncharacterized protein n=2 Tax=Tetranychus urticae TaxID=32264 RepID=T1L4C4_TETUR
MLRGMRKQMKSICTDPVDQKKAIKIYGCTSETSMRAWNECFHSANRQFMFAAVNSTDRQLFPDLCCMYPRIEKCVVTQMKPKTSCKSDSNLDIAGFYRATVEISIKDTLDLACANFATEEQCNKVNPQGVKALTEAGESNYKVPEPFYLYPLLKVLGRLADSR